METQASDGAAPRKDWKYRLGIGLLVYSFLPLVSVELVAFLPLTSGQAVAVGAVYVATGEIAFLAAAALLGKPFIRSVKDKIKAFFKRAVQTTPPKPISRARHRLGVALFAASFVPYYLTIAALIIGHPGEPNITLLIWLLVCGEALFFVSLYVLGEEFWARLKRLFEWPGAEQTG